MIRWSYLVPRLTLLAACWTGLYFGLDPLARWGLITAGQRLIGARVEIGQLDSKVSRGRLAVTDIGIANPEKPQENALECAGVQLDFNSRSLLRKRWVVDHGSLSGLQLGELRLTDGSLPQAPDSDSGATAPAWQNKAIEAGEAWFKKTSLQLSDDVQAQLKSPPLARELSQRWPQQYAALEQRAHQLREQAKQLQTDAKKWKESPWTVVDQLPQIAGRVDHLRQEGAAVKQELLALREQLAQDRQSIEEARRHDQAYLRDKLRPEFLQPETLTEYLVGAQWKPYLEQLIGWVQWSRGQLTNRPAGALAVGRGMTIDFLSTHPEPRWLVKQLELDGSGTANREPFTFKGVLTNLTSDPRIVQQPARLQVELSGAHQATIEAIVDHTGPRPTEKLAVQCPRIVQPARTLGNRDGLAMELARGVGSLGLELQLVGDQLQGKIGLQRPTVSLTPRVSESHRAASFQTALTEATSAVKDLDVQIYLAGHWKRPAWQVRSNLGAQLATGMNQAVQAELVRRSDVLLADADSVIQRQIGQWQGKLEEKQAQILAELNVGDQQLTWVKQQITALVPVPANVPGGLPSSKEAVKDALRKVLR